MAGRLDAIRPLQPDDGGEREPARRPGPRERPGGGSAAPRAVRRAGDRQHDPERGAAARRRRGARRSRRAPPRPRRRSTGRGRCRRGRATGPGRRGRSGRRRGRRARAAMPGPWSTTSRLRAAVLGAEARPRPACGRRVHAHVREQVAHHLAEPVLVAGRPARPGADVGRDRPRRLDARASATASATSALRSTRSWRIGRPWSSRASSSRSSTSAPIRLALGPDAAHRLLQRRRRRTGRRRGTGRRSRGAPSSGVRSSCEASATNRRSRSSERAFASSAACWSSNAAWIRSSIASNAVPSRPTSVRSCGQLRPVRQVAAGDRVGGRGDPLERPQAAPDEQPADHERRRGEHHAARRAAGSGQRADGVVDAVERRGRSRRDARRSGRAPRAAVR